MKRLLMLLLLAPAMATADHELISEEWSTYCYSGVEKVRVSLTFHIEGNPTFNGMHGELEAREGEGCVASGQCGDRRWNTGEVSAVGNDNYRWLWEGFERECLSGTTALRYGVVFFWLTNDDGTPRYWYIDFECGSPFEIVDNEECSPLPVASTTGGAIKALYR